METDIHPYRKPNSIFNHLPVWAMPYVLLARWDRPIGVVLLFLPCCWGLALADVGRDQWHLYAKFFMGAIAMRGAGCTYNDMIDINLDERVERTRVRPLPAQDTTLTKAIILLVVQLLVGFFIFYYFNLVAQIVAATSLVLAALYPFMKRWTYWPQAFLGLTFNWGIFVAYAAIHERLSLSCFVAYGAAICWTVIYDTIYACQDREEDKIAGVKSTALFFREHIKTYMYVFIGFMCAGLLFLGYILNASLVYYVLTMSTLFYLSSILHLLNVCDSAACLNFFKRNSLIGLLIFLAICAR